MLHDSLIDIDKAPMPDPHDLQRFVVAQDPVIDQVRRELREGAKRTHWMWFVFPQLRGLGSSGMAQRYAIASLDEARGYLDHPVLGERLVDCTRIVNQVEHRTLGQIFGSPDDAKFRSSMTLFAKATTSGGVFEQALDQYCGGVPDARTIELLRS